MTNWFQPNGFRRAPSRGTRPLRSVRWMSRLHFGSFLAPHHPIGEHPTLQLQRDLELVTHLDRLGFDEFWCGEHHSCGWETIASPEMFLACAAQWTSTIRLGTGVVSLPYHHPFNVAQRIVQLDHMTRGRAMFGSGPGALPSDAAYVRHRPRRAARPPGRGARRHHPPAAGRAKVLVRVRLVRAARRPSSRCCRSRTTCRGDGVVDLAIGDADWRGSTASACSRSRPTRRKGSKRCRHNGGSPRRPRPRTGPWSIAGTGGC